MFWDTFLSVLGVIGIVAVAAFVIVFLSDLFITIVDGTNGIFFKRHKKQNSVKESNVIKKPKLLSRPVENLMAPKNEEIIHSKSVQECQVDLDKAQEEEDEITKINLKRQNLVAQRSAIVPVKEEDEEDEDEEDEIAFKKLSTEPEPATEEETASAEEDEEEDEEDEDDKMISSIAKEMKDNLNAKESKNAIMQKIESDSNREKLENEIEELKAQILEANEIIREFKEKQSEGKTSTAVTGSREDLEQKLDNLRARLKENEKELSVNRKEFVPLRRVNKTLDSDKNKLRRREAIVAKQKVMLYGVNNYVDIDEEKAKKLSEELDLLEGLRLSVQHCDEVMQKNMDRYPILERANKFLTKNQIDLKADIESLEEQLKVLEENADDEEDNENNSGEE